MSIFAVIETSTNLCDNVVEWNDAEHPWVAPENHYTINIDGVEVGIAQVGAGARGVAGQEYGEAVRGCRQQIEGVAG